MSFPFEISNPGIGAVSQFTSGETTILQGIAGLIDPNADRVLFWDDSAGAYAYLTMGTGLTITGTTLDVSAGAGDVTKVGTPIDGQVGVWTGVASMEGDAALTFDTITDVLSSGGLLLSGLTASELVITNASKQLVSAAVATYPSLTELTYVKGVTSAIQTQMNLKAPLASPTFTGTVTVPTPTSDTDASTKAYVDATAQGLAVKESVRVATAAALPTNTYSNGASGVGATLTAVALGALTVDGVAMVLNDRILVKDEVATANNGIYYVSVAGTAGVAYVLTRSLNMDTTGEFSGAFCFSEEGTTNADAGFVCTANDPITVGTTAITFTQFSGAGQITAGAGLTKTGNTLDVIGTANRIVVAADTVDIGTDVVTLTGTQSLSGKTLTTPVLTGLPTGTGVATANTVSTLVARDASGNFAAGTITAALTGTASGNLVSGGALGTPSSATLTNATGLPAASVVAGILGVTGTRMTKVWATDVESTNAPTVGGVAVPTISSTNTLTNKRVTPRILSATSYTTDTGTSLNADNYDIFSVTAQAGALLFNAPGGTPTDGQKLIITVASSTTAARALTWNAIFEASTVALPTTTAATTAQLNIGFMYSTGRIKWVCLASA